MSRKHPRVSISFPEQGLTKQSHKDACDINQIMHRYIRLGNIDHVNQYAPQYGFATSLDFQAAVELVETADNMFSDLPAETRAYFYNDPANFLEFVQNPENAEKIRELGLTNATIQESSLETEKPSKKEGKTTTKTENAPPPAD